MLAPEVPAPRALATDPPTAARGLAGADEFARKLGKKPAELHALVADLAKARAPIYWADLLATGSVAYVTFWLAASQAAWLVPCACAVYRLTLFTHELAHVPQGELGAFRVAWNLVCGIPLLVPSFLYEMHATHHDRRTFASEEDGEYLAFAALPRSQALGSVVLTVFAVPALVLRFLVGAPLGWLIPPLRRFLLTKLSALVIDFRFSRALPSPLPLRWTTQEAACFAWCALLLWLTASGRLSPSVLLRGYLVVSAAVFTNAVRVLCAHRYRAREAATFVEQVLDSNNFPDGLSWLWAPLGLRYHAVHHLFPSLPYHTLGTAYRRLMQALPHDSAFRQTYRRSLFAGLDDVIGRRRVNGSRS